MNTKRINPADIYAGMKIRMARNAMGMSQVALAGKLGVTFQQIQKYEKGTNRVGASRLHALAIILKVPITFFFEEGEDFHFRDVSTRDEADRVVQFLSTREGRLLNLAFQRVANPQIRRLVIDMVEVLAEERPKPK